MNSTQDNQSELATKQSEKGNSTLSPASAPTPETIKWTPMKGGGFNFRTHSLVRVSDQKMEFRPSLTAKLFCGAFAGLGLFVPVYHHAVEDVIDSQMGSLGESLVAVGVGCILIFAGIKFWSLIKGSRVFDKSSGRFINNGRDYRSVSLDEIIALQHLREKVKRSGSSLGSSHKRTSFVSNELNLVLRNGNRVHAIDHSNRRKLREDIETLAGFLGVPVWDHP